MSDLRVGYAPFIFCTDASPDGAGICQSPECESVVQELWRHSEQRGYYTQLPVWLREVSFQTGMQEHLVKRMELLEGPD